MDSRPVPKVMLSSPPGEMIKLSPTPNGIIAALPGGRTVTVTSRTGGRADAFRFFLHVLKASGDTYEVHRLVGWSPRGELVTSERDGTGINTALKAPKQSVLSMLKMHGISAKEIPPCPKT
jgi:hypothetical protein